MPLKYKVDASSDEVIDILARMINENASIALMRALVDVLVDRKVYPKSTKAMRKHKYTHMDMVKGWGPRWHEYEFPHFCARCGSSWKDEVNGPPFKKEVALYGIEVDMAIQMQCPECKTIYSGREYEDIMLSQRRMSQKKIDLVREKTGKRAKKAAKIVKSDKPDDPAEPEILCYPSQ